MMRKTWHLHKRQWFIYQSFIQIPDIAEDELIPTSREERKVPYNNRPPLRRQT
ncbi:MAG TPA: hypothetical protein VFU05_09320 [Cyclobacteriaceae bacterium]|nr:hypothetical protein [Cyclobacteriaceae bacterium]